MNEALTFARFAILSGIVATGAICTATCGEEPERSDAANLIKNDVRTLATAALDADADRDSLWALYHSAMQKRLGGRSDFDKGFPEAQAMFAKNGIKVHSFEFRKDPEYFETDARKYVAMEVEVVLASEKLAERKPMAWLGVKEAGAEKWTYLDVTGTNSDILREHVFSDFPEGRKFAGGYSIRGPREKVLADGSEKMP
jgi:hypothetical protein